MREPSGDQQQHVTQSVWPVSWAYGRLRSRTSQSKRTLFLHAARNCLPLGEKLQSRTSSWQSIGAVDLPVRKSHIRRDLSSLPVNRILPHHRKDNDDIFPPWPLKVTKFFPVLLSQTFVVKPQSPAAISLDSTGQYLALAILLVPGSVQMTDKILVSHILSDPSAEPVNNFEPVFSNVTLVTICVCCKLSNRAVDIN